MDPVTVARWCDQGELACYRTPGGHRRVRREDLLGFLRAHRMQVPQELESRALRVLAVDDDAHFIKGIETRLRNHGGRVELHTAAGAVDGLMRLGSALPDVLVLNLLMPGIDGLEVFRQIRAVRLRRTDGRIRLIAVLPAEDPRASRRALKAGADACLTKPVDFKKLETLLLG